MRYTAWKLLGCFCVGLENSTFVRRPPLYLFPPNARLLRSAALASSPASLMTANSFRLLPLLAPSPMEEQLRRVLCLQHTSGQVTGPMRGFLSQHGFFYSYGRRASRRCTSPLRVVNPVAKVFPFLASCGVATFLPRALDPA